jgi:hypothetical protein
MSEATNVAVLDDHVWSTDPLSAEDVRSLVTPPSRMGIVAALLPSVLFLVGHRWGGLVPAIVAASVASVALIVVRRRQNRTLGVLLPASLAYVSVRAAAGLLTNSDEVYFGVSLATSAVVALVVAATAFTRTPVAARLIPLVVVYPQRTVAHPLYRRVAAHATLAWAATELAMTAWETTHLADMAAPQFMLLRTFGGAPVMAVLIPVVIFYIRLRLDPLAHRQRMNVPGTGASARA